ncbi:hypothetical protein RIF29_39549 [Crotalaria pallida]|uniref:Uncharacterized protein n=1 Tax=Crotalaria pallida TaxID=3830 RepID=A0AAN9E1F9_CROPI
MPTLVTLAQLEDEVAPCKLLQLLLKASQDKKFVSEEADRALGIIVGSMTHLPLLQKLMAYVSHKNLRVGAKAAVSLTNCVSKMGLEEMEEFGLGELIEVGCQKWDDARQFMKYLHFDLGVGNSCANQTQTWEEIKFMCLESLPKTFHSLHWRNFGPDSLKSLNVAKVVVVFVSIAGVVMTTLGKTWATDDLELTAA